MSYVYDPFTNKWIKTKTTQSFRTHQTDLGTSPVADSADDILTWTSSDGSVDITGNSGTDTIDLSVDASAIDAFNPDNIVFVSTGFTNDTGAKRFSSIQTAYDYVKNNESPTQTSPWLVFVYPGNYHENLTFDTDYIHIASSNDSDTVVTAPSGTILTVSSYYCSIESMSFVATPGIKAASFSGDGTGAYFTRMHLCSFQAVGQDGNKLTLGAGARVTANLCAFVQTNDTTDILDLSMTTGEFQPYQCYIRGETNLASGTLTSQYNAVEGKITASNSSVIVASYTRIESTTTTAVVDTSGTFRVAHCEFVSGGGDDTVVVSTQPMSGSVDSCTFSYSGTAPDYSVRADVSYQFSGFGNTFARGNNGSAVNALTTLREVGPGLEYRLIDDANSAASSGDTVLISSGTYSEQVELKSDVTYASKVGLASSVIIQRASEPITLAAGFTGCTVKGLTFKCTTSGNELVQLESGEIEFLDCVFYDGYISGDDLTSDTDPTFIRCDFYAEDTNYYVLTDESSATYISRWTFKFCSFNSLSGVPLFKHQPKGAAGGGDGNIKLNNCDIEGIITIDPYETVYPYIIKCNLNRVYFDSSNGGSYSAVKFTLNSVQALGPCVYWDAVCGFNHEIVGNTFVNFFLNSEYVVEDGRSLGPFPVFYGNAFTSGIKCNGTGKFDVDNAIFYVRGGTDCFYDMQSAVQSITDDNKKIVIGEDQTLTSALSIPSYKIMIDGNHQFSLEYASGSTICSIGDDTELTFKNIDLGPGNIYLDGTSNSIKIHDHAYLYGSVIARSGCAANSSIDIDQAKLESDTSTTYPIHIQSTLASIRVARSSIFGTNTGGSAVYWETTNTSFKSKYSVFNNGLNTTTANPFSANTSTISITFNSHHDAYNCHPENVTTTGTFTNNIADTTTGGNNNTYSKRVNY